MAKEEFEYEEESCEQDENLDPTERQIRRLERQMDHISDIMETTDPLTPAYDQLNSKLEQLSRTKANLEEGLNAKAQKEDARENRIFKALNIFSPVLGAMVAENIKQRWELKKIDRTINHEKENCITTKATKWWR